MSSATTSFLDKIRRQVGLHQPRRIEPSGRAAAGVLILCYDVDEETHLLFTKRTELVEHHKGEICFPGGARETADADLYQTALRETFEEVGLRPEHVELVGQLDDIVSRGSNFVISPYVGIISAPVPYAFDHARHEVEEILEAPLAHLLDGGNVTRETRDVDGGKVELYFYRFGQHTIWGATARILHQLLGLLSEDTAG
jgi:8-oxo-dGTP pyrophosphatase MutT (NUDIX family)